MNNEPDCLTILLGICLLNKTTLSLPLAEEIKDAITITNVVTLTPPAVDPGLPPMNINTIVNNLPELVKAFKSIALKPAVLGLTDKKNEFNTFSPKVRLIKLPDCPKEVHSKI